MCSQISSAWIIQKYTKIHPLDGRDTDRLEQNEGTTVVADVADVTLNNPENERADRIFSGYEWRILDAETSEDASPKLRY